MTLQPPAAGGALTGPKATADVVIASPVLCRALFEVRQRGWRRAQKPGCVESVVTSVAAAAAAVNTATLMFFWSGSDISWLACTQVYLGESSVVPDARREFAAGAKKLLDDANAGRDPRKR